ncbi:MAG: hypothetical protein MUC88_17650 [Planctomycetes bacterium]|nr:hypothetical protein [Planctomycetota bacterium]
MRKLLWLGLACLLLVSGPVSGAIIYSGSQNVTLTLPPMSPMASQFIQIANDDNAAWDDFQVDLGMVGAMGMPSMMGMGTRLDIYYLGFQTAMGQYGWLHLLSQSGIGTENHTALFDGWAYESQPGQSIGAGSTSIVPVPGAIGLALLGMGVGTWRRRRSPRARKN